MGEGRGEGSLASLPPLLDRPSSSPPLTLLITCEHGGNSIPAPYRPLFRTRKKLLHSHRGWDPGALHLAKLLARRLRAPVIASTTSRLLVDLNRSEDNPTLFSPITAPLQPNTRAQILADHYHPYRADVESAVRNALETHPAVLHLSIHTFTPILRAHRRDTDIGLLFDPARSPELALCRAWRRALTAHAQPHRHPPTIHLNRPYKGTDDGLTTHLRTLFPPDRYLGIELEVNQRYPRRDGPSWPRIQTLIAATLAELLASPDLLTPHPPPAAPA